MQAAGWIVIILFGFVFALLAVFLVSNVNCSPCLDFRHPDVALLIPQQQISCPSSLHSPVFTHVHLQNKPHGCLDKLWHSSLRCVTMQVWVDIKFAGAVYNSEQFNTAGRSIGTGLLAVDIVSHWTWASILLQSVSYGWFYGITGSYWCALQTNPKG